MEVVNFPHRLFFKSHLDLCSIVQHISCPSTPEQNEVTKRKHRYIVETGFTMLFYAQLPKNLWIESFLTAVYLINQLPSSVLGTDTQFFKLHEVHPDNSSLKDFGRRCFPYLRDQSKNNLNRSFTPVFSLAIVPRRKSLGVFIRLQREFISPRVVFDESILSYTDPKSLFAFATTGGSFSTNAKCSSGFLSSQQASVAPPVSLPKLLRLTLPVLGNYTWDTSIISITSISSSTTLPPSAPTITLALDSTSPVATPNLDLDPVPKEPKTPLVAHLDSSTSTPASPMVMIDSDAPTLPGTLYIDLPVNPMLGTSMPQSSSTSSGWSLRQLDMKNAFLRGHLKGVAYKNAFCFSLNQLPPSTKISIKLEAKQAEKTQSKQHQNKTRFPASLKLNYCQYSQQTHRFLKNQIPKPKRRDNKDSQQ